jgi:hypothetical protein
MIISLLTETLLQLLTAEFNSSALLREGWSNALFRRLGLLLTLAAQHIEEHFGDNGWHEQNAWRTQQVHRIYESTINVLIVSGECKHFSIYQCKIGNPNGLLPSVFG